MTSHQIQELSEQINALNEKLNVLKNDVLLKKVAKLAHPYPSKNLEIIKMKGNYIKYHYSYKDGRVLKKFFGTINTNGSECTDDWKVIYNRHIHESPMPGSSHISHYCSESGTDVMM